MAVDVVLCRRHTTRPNGLTFRLILVALPSIAFRVPTRWGGPPWWSSVTPIRVAARVAL